MNSVAKVMAELKPAGRKIRLRRSLTRPGKRPTAPDFVRRDFTAEEPDSSGAAISQRSTQMRASCAWRRSSIFSPAACWATRWASGMMRSWWWRRSTWPRRRRTGRDHDKGRGSEYTSQSFWRAYRRAGVAQFTGRVGSCFDNAVSKAFNSVLKVEYVHPACLPHPHRGPHQDRHLDHRLLQRQAATQHVRVQEPDRLLT